MWRTKIVHIALMKLTIYLNNKPLSETHYGKPLKATLNLKAFVRIPENDKYWEIYPHYIKY